MRRVLLSVMAIGIVGILAGAGTLAYFSDTETSGGNTFTADIFDADLKLDDDNEGPSDGVTASLYIIGWNPSETYRGWISLHNAGTELAPSTIMHWEVADSGGETPEAELEANPGNDVNDLSSQIIIEHMRYGWQGPPPTDYPPADIVPQIKDNLGILASENLTVANLHCENIDLEEMMRIYFYEEEGHPPASHPGMEGGQTDYLVIDFLFDPSAGNEYQGDVCTADITFTIYQQKQ